MNVSNKKEMKMKRLLPVLFIVALFLVFMVSCAPDSGC
jgi:hypothetical protein